MSETFDPHGLREARRARLRVAMAAAGHDALVLTTASGIRYATGAVPLHGDASREASRPCVAVLTAREVYVLGIEPGFVPPDVAAAPWPRDAASALAERVAGARRVGVDRLPYALGAALARMGVELVGAETSLTPARTIKSDDEIALLREAQRRNEAAIHAVLPLIRPGVREVELTGAFLAAMAHEGVIACHVEPIWCVVPRTSADAPWRFADGLPYRELPSAERVLAAGDQVMIDTGMLHRGYMSDFGCTWRSGGETTASDRALRARWQAIVDAVVAACRPGAPAADLHRAALAANGTERPAPWPRPLYLAHGIGLGGVEPPFIGTDAGLAVEETVVLAAGMVLVLEPYAWEEGAGGYRAEQTVAVTATGCTPLSAPPP